MIRLVGFVLAVVMIIVLILAVVQIVSAKGNMDASAQGLVRCPDTTLAVGPSSGPPGLTVFQFTLLTSHPQAYRYWHSFKFLPEELDGDLHHVYGGYTILWTQVALPTTKNIAYSAQVYDESGNYLCGSGTYLLPVDFGEWPVSVYLPIVMK